MECYKFLDRYARKIIAPRDADYSEINVIPYFYSLFTKGTDKVHIHDFWEISLIIKGSLEHKINDKKYELKERDIVLVRPQDKHQVYTKPDNVAEFYNFVIRESFFKQFLDSINKSLYEEFLKSENICINCDEIMFQQLRSLLGCIYTMEEKDYKEKQKYLEIIIARILSDVLARKTEIKRGNFLVEEILDYMRAIENMSCTLADVARTFGYCSEHILRVFQKNGLDTPSKEWKKIKMTYASNMLADTSHTIMDISQMIGINNVNYFSKIFKEFFGVSPSQYRKEHIGIGR